jgi:tRNA(Ile)-lysidine synthase
VRRYRDALHAMAPLPEHDARRTIAWNPDSAPVLPMGRLVISRRSGGVADRVMTGKALSIRFRQGGERLLLSDGHRHSLKTLLQDRGLAPWLRRYLPLFYCGEEIAAVPGVGVNQRFRAAPGEEGWGIEWRL